MVIATPADNVTFLLPTSSALNGVDVRKPYDWSVDWGDGATETVSGSSAKGGGIEHTYAVAGYYDVTINSNGTTEAWLAAFGFYTGYEGSNSLENKSLVIGVLGVLTPEMTRTADQLGGVGLAPDYEWAYTFYECVNLLNAPLFVSWEDVSSVGRFFAERLFYGCSGLYMVPNTFSLPQDIESVGDNFALQMFCGCSSLISFPEGFNLPPKIVSLKDCFATEMFYNCTSLVGLPDSFSLPAGASEVGGSYAAGMFRACTSLTRLPEGFNFPQSLVIVGDLFAYNMFASCSSLTSLPTGFQLPQDISGAADYFAAWMLADCPSLDSLPPSFNFPQNLHSVGSNFAVCFLYASGSDTFQINDKLCFPSSVGEASANAWYKSLQLSDHAPLQNRLAASLIASCPTPPSKQETFGQMFRDIDYIAVNWGGKGLPAPPTGEAGSGDWNGDGVVTMDEVILALQATISNTGLDQAFIDVFDMDFDGMISMADVIIALRLTLV